jgi:very-short-patch-repair endonuclease
LGWIPDSWRPAIKLALEIDANINEAKTRGDPVRDPHLERHGIRTLHVRAEDTSAGGLRRSRSWNSLPGPPAPACYTNQ